MRVKKKKKKKEKCDKFFYCIPPLVHDILQKIADLFSLLKPAFRCCFDHTQANSLVNKIIKNSITDGLCALKMLGNLLAWS
jgi:hypothetical protein